MFQILTRDNSEKIKKLKMSKYEGLIDSPRFLYFVLNCFLKNLVITQRPTTLRSSQKPDSPLSYKTLGHTNWRLPSSKRIWESPIFVPYTQRLLNVNCVYVSVHYLTWTTKCRSTNSLYRSNYKSFALKSIHSLLY